MNKSTITGVVVGAAAATAIAGFAGYAYVNDDTTGSPQAPATESVAEQRCYDVTVDQPAAARDDKEIAGTVIGALVGGAVGRDVGDSDLTTAAGAAAGAYAGKKAQEKYQENKTETTTEKRCD